MYSDYDDRNQDLEQPWRTGSSSGIETQRLATTQSNSPAAHVPPVFQPVLTSPNRRNNIAALGLIGIGVLMLLGRVAFVQIDFTPGLILLTIASCFLFFAFSQRIYGLSIPGFILAGLSIGVTFANLTNGVSVLWGLSLGFLAIYLLGQALFRQFGWESRWAIIPSVILFGIGAITAIASLPSFFAGSLIWVPLLLVGAGLYLGWGRTR